ncbi:Major Facilitator Superfamily protein [Polystyrenella longa]|uniref:Major Facilitator Superfamily protein n=2 Tax=Polystyrenella longa TaxID=2528007 RepID=A0A518CU57_9PLAN|nr:Major Facilitator Superfamily protein [Polystyrenella longa]
MPVAPGSQKQLEVGVAKNQALWSLGHVITSGAFLHYFIYDLDVSFAAISIVIALPELVGLFALFTRVLLQFQFRLKKIWTRCLFASRLVALGIPFCLLLDDNNHDNSHLVMLLLVFLGVSEILQAFSYTAYVSWLSVLSPRSKWGELFAFRNIAKLIVLMIWATAIGLIRDRLNTHYTRDDLDVFYVLAFVSGILLQLVSWWPLRKLPDTEVNPEIKRVDWGQLFHSIWRYPSLRWLLMHSWTLAFFNGLTQSVFFFYSRNVLDLSLTYSFVLLGLMRFVKLPVSYLAGKACDQGRDKQMLWGGLLLANAGLFFWFPSTAEQTGWLVGCYLLWGFYAAANIGGLNLLLKHSPPGDNTLQLALFYRVAGMLAGLSGLFGGYLLSEYFSAFSMPFSNSDPQLISDIYFEIFGWRWQLGGDPSEPGKYHTIILLSLLGRYFALLFLLKVDPHPQADQPSGE